MVKHKNSDTMEIPFSKIVAELQEHNSIYVTRPNMPAHPLLFYPQAMIPHPALPKEERYMSLHNTLDTSYLVLEPSNSYAVDTHEITSSNVLSPWMHTAPNVIVAYSSMLFSPCITGTQNYILTRDYDMLMTWKTILAAKWETNNPLTPETTQARIICAVCGHDVTDVNVFDIHGHLMRVLSGYAVSCFAV